MQIILATMTGLLFPAVILLFKNNIEQKNKNKELQSKLEKKQVEELKMLTNGVCLLIRINIIDYHKTYTREGRIPLYALENAKTLYSVYSIFGENGVHDLMEELGELPIKN